MANEKKMIEDFIQKRTEEERMLTIQFAKEILALQLDKKKIDEDIKAVKADAKSNGVLVTKVMKALSEIKKVLKTEDADLQEEQRILNMIEEDENIKAMIYDLIKKD